LSIIVTDAGIQIESKEEQAEKASDSIRVSIDPNWNVTDESESHSQKERSNKIAMVAGMQIDIIRTEENVA
jgi:tRNA(His) 5'-end guanylyltransferase